MSKEARAKGIRLLTKLEIFTKSSRKAIDGSVLISSHRYNLWFFVTSDRKLLAASQFVGWVSDYSRCWEYMLLFPNQLNELILLRGQQDPRATGLVGGAGISEFLWGSACWKGGPRTGLTMPNLFVSWSSSCQTPATSASPDWSTMLGGLIGAEIESAATQGETILRLGWPVRLCMTNQNAGACCGIS